MSIPIDKFVQAVSEGRYDGREYGGTAYDAVDLGILTILEEGLINPSHLLAVYGRTLERFLRRRELDLRQSGDTSRADWLNDLCAIEIPLWKDKELPRIDSE